jgi:hypothetical protein
MVDETASSFYVVMEFVAGGELFDEILERERFTERDAAPLICQVSCLFVNFSFLLFFGLIFFLILIFFLFITGFSFEIISFSSIVTIM